MRGQSSELRIPTLSSKRAVSLFALTTLSLGRTNVVPAKGDSSWVAEAKKRCDKMDMLAWSKSDMIRTIVPSNTAPTDTYAAYTRRRGFPPPSRQGQQSWNVSFLGPVSAALEPLSTKLLNALDEWAPKIAKLVRHDTDKLSTEFRSMMLWTC